MQLKNLPTSKIFLMMTSTPTLRLVYFQVRARAECARMILAYGNIAYKEDDCNSYFGMSFPEAKKAGKLPFGQLPVLEVGGADGKLIGIILINFKIIWHL